MNAGGKEGPCSDGEEAKQQVLHGTGSRSLNSARGRLSCTDRLSVDLRQQQHLAALRVTKQPSLGTALLASRGDGPRKGGLNKACLILTWLVSRGQPASLPSGKKNERRRQQASSYNISTMQDSEDRPQRRSALVARELAQLDIDIAALSEVCRAEQGSLTENRGLYPFWSGKNKDNSLVSAS